MNKDEFSLGHSVFEMLWDILIEIFIEYRYLRFMVNELD